MRKSSKNEYSPSSSLLFVCRQHSCDSSWIDRDYYINWSWYAVLVNTDLLYCLLSLLSASLSSLSGGSLKWSLINLLSVKRVKVSAKMLHPGRCTSSCPPLLLPLFLHQDQDVATESFVLQHFHFKPMFSHLDLPAHRCDWRNMFCRWRPASPPNLQEAPPKAHLLPEGSKASWQDLQCQRHLSRHLRVCPSCCSTNSSSAWTSRLFPSNLCIQLI